MAASNDHIRKVVGLYVEFMNASNVDGIADLYALDATIEDPIGTEPHHGREAIRKFYAASAGHVTLELTGNPRVAGGEVAFPMRATLGEDQVIEIIDVMAFDDDGRIANMRAFWSAS